MPRPSQLRLVVVGGVAAGSAASVAPDSGRVRQIADMTAKLAASTTKATGAPTLATITPATAGPAIEATSQLAASSEFAASSWSSHTRRGTSAASATSVSEDSSALAAAIP